MDSFEFNKIMGALLATCLALLVLNFTAEAIFEPHHPAKPGFEIPVPKPGTAADHGGEPKAEAKADEPIGKLLASASVERGLGEAKKVCTTCHNFQKGEPNKVGPNLYGVVGRPRGSVTGFSYSDGMKAKGGEWTAEDLNKFLTKPSDFVPGTRMNISLTKASQRADVIAFLNSLADNPKPLPVEGQ